MMRGYLRVVDSHHSCQMAGPDRQTNGFKKYSQWSIRPRQPGVLLLCKEAAGKRKQGRDLSCNAERLHTQLLAQWWQGGIIANILAAAENLQIICEGCKHRLDSWERGRKGLKGSRDINAVESSRKGCQHRDVGRLEKNGHFRLTAGYIEGRDGSFSSREGTRAETTWMRIIELNYLVLEQMGLGRRNKDLVWAWRSVCVKGWREEGWRWRLEVMTWVISVSTQSDGARFLFSVYLGQKMLSTKGMSIAHFC